MAYARGDEDSSIRTARTKNSEIERPLCNEYGSALLVFSSDFRTRLFEPSKKMDLYEIGTLSTLQKSPTIVMSIGKNPGDVYSLLQNSVSVSSKFCLVHKEEDASRMTIGKIEKGELSCFFHVEVTRGGNGSDLHFTPVREEDSSSLAGALVALVFAISNYSRRPKMYDSKLVPFRSEVTEGNLEKVATFLQIHQQSTLVQIADNLEMQQVDVALSLQKLIKKGVVGFSPSHVKPRLFFLK